MVGDQSQAKQRREEAENEMDVLKRELEEKRQLEL